MSKSWQTICAERKQKQNDAIPPEWKISVPEQTNGSVQHIPEQCGLLTARELEITNTTDLDVLLGKLATAVWSSVEVTTAFYKRAIIAHQLVSRLNRVITTDIDIHTHTFVDRQIV
jgi:amidase